MMDHVYQGKISTRYCLQCMEIMKFELNTNIGHSECTECGGRVCIHTDSYKQIAKKVMMGKVKNTCSSEVFTDLKEINQYLSYNHIKKEAIKYVVVIWKK